MSRRISLCVLMFTLGLSSVLFCRVAPVAAQNKKNPAAQQIQVLQAELQQSQQTVANLKQQVTTLQSQLKKEKTEDKQDAKTASSLTTIQSAGLVHVVVLKPKSDAGTSEVQSLMADAESLRKIKGVRGLWFGKPAAKGTPDVPAQDYGVSLVVLFDNAAGLKQYLDDPAHKKFADKHLSKWETPVVYDFEPKKHATP